MLKNNAKYRNKLIEYFSTLGIKHIEIDSKEVIAYQKKHKQNKYKNKYFYLQSYLATKYKNIIEAPFCSGLGILWRQKTIVSYSDVEWPALIHEAGHLAASKIKPENANEFEFYGWEWAVVNYLNLPINDWIKNNSEYVIDWEYEDKFYLNVGALKNKSIQEKFFSKRMYVAKKSGLISSKGLPKSLLLSK